MHGVFSKAPKKTYGMYFYNIWNVYSGLSPFKFGLIIIFHYKIKAWTNTGTDWGLKILQPDGGKWEVLCFCGNPCWFNQTSCMRAKELKTEPVTTKVWGEQHEPTIIGRPSPSIHLNMVMGMGLLPSHAPFKVINFTSGANLNCILQSENTVILVGLHGLAI